MVSVGFLCNAQETPVVEVEETAGIEMVDSRMAVYDRGAHCIKTSPENQVYFDFKNSKYNEVIKVQSIVFNSPENSIAFFEKIIDMLDQPAPAGQESINGNMNNAYLARYGQFPSVVRVDTQKGYTYVSKRNAVAMVEAIQQKNSNI